MKKTKIITNALCDLPPTIAEEHGIIMLPESICFDGQLLFSNVDFTPAQLYERMRTCNELPKAAHPNVGAYMDAFTEAAVDGGDIVCVSMTSKMSGNYNTACIAKQMLIDEGFDHDIYVVDSLELTHGMAFLALKGSEMADAGLGGKEIAQELDRLKSKIGIYFALRSLENARKGGRLGLITARVAESLNIKPVCMFRDGIESDVKVAYCFKHALRYLPDYYKKRAKRGSDVVIFHANNTADAHWVESEIKKYDPDVRVYIQWLGSAIGIYTGEGCVGITFWEP